MVGRGYAELGLTSRGMASTTVPARVFPCRSHYSSRRFIGSRLICQQRMGRSLV